jgi:hypothetical protein
VSKCSKTRNAISQLEDTNQLLDTLVEAKLEQENPGYTKFVEESSQKLIERYSLDKIENNLIDEDSFDSEIKFKNEKDRVMYKILTLLANDKMLLDQYAPILAEIVDLKYKPKKGDVSYKKIETLIKEGKLKKGQKTAELLKRLDVGVLKDIFAGLIQRQRIMQGQNPDAFAMGRIGDFYIAYKTPENLGMIEKSGAILGFARYMNELPRNISRKIERGWSDNPQTKERGIESIIEEVEGLRTLDQYDNKPGQFRINFAEESKSDLKRKFFYYMARGIIRKNKDGQYEIATSYSPRMGKDGKLMRYDPKPGEMQGDIMHQLGDYVPVYPYTNEYGEQQPGYQNNYLAIDFTKESFDAIDNLLEEYRAKNDKIWATKNKNDEVVGGIPFEFEQSVKELLIEFDKAFPELAELEIDFVEKGEEKTLNLGNVILFGKNPKIKSQAIEIARNELSKSQVDKLNKMLDTFERFISDSRILSKSENVDADKVETYFPVLYHEEYVERGFNEISNGLETQIRLLEDQIDLEPTPELEELLHKKQSRLENVKNAQIANIAAADDMTSGDKVIFQSSSKHFKSYTGALDIRNMRTDKGVYYDYLRYNYSQIERNKAAAQLIKHMNMTDNNAVWDYLIDHYNVPYNGKNTKTKLGFFDLDPHGRISKIMSVDKLDRATRMGSAFLTSALLGKLMTGVTNSTAAFQNIYKHSYNDLKEAAPIAAYLSDVFFWDKGTDGYTKDELNALENILARSGIVDMSNFFGEAMVDKISENMLEQEVHQRILNLMTKYIVLSNNNPAKATELQIELNDEIRAILDKSNKFTESFKPKISLDVTSSAEQLNQIKKSSELNRQRKADSISQAFVQYAINKSLPIFNHLQSSDEVSKLGGLKLFGKKTALVTYGSLAKILKRTSMGATETFVRTIPFIIGLKKAIRDGKLPQKRGFHQYTPKEVETAINIGKLYSDKANYSLSTTGLGAAFRGPFARITGKLVGWSNQKFQDDAKLINQLYNSYASVDILDQGNKDKKALWKVIKDMYVLPSAGVVGGLAGATVSLGTLGVLGGLVAGAGYLYKTRVKNETDYAKKESQKFILMQGLTTLATDLLFFGATRAFSGFKGLMYGSPGGVAVQRVAGGFSSDLLSLAYMPLVLGMQFIMAGDDEEMVANKLRYYLRRLPLGFAINWGIDSIIQLAEALLGSKEWQEVSGNIAKPITSGLQPTGLEKPAMMAGEKIYDMVFDD